MPALCQKYTARKKPDEIEEEAFPIRWMGNALGCQSTRKFWKTGRKIAAKETQEGCLSLSINRFSELFEVLKNASSLAKRLFRQAEAFPIRWMGNAFARRGAGAAIPLIGRGRKGRTAGAPHGPLASARQSPQARGIAASWAAVPCLDAPWILRCLRPCVMILTVRRGSAPEMAVMPRAWPPHDERGSPHTAPERCRRGCGAPFGREPAGNVI